RLAAGSRIVADYMFAKDRLFASLTLSGAELALYEAVYNLVAPHAPRPAAVVHLRAALPTLLQRIAARARPFERDLRPEYLERLAAAYDAFFETYDQAPVITVDTDRLELRDESSVAAVAAVVTDACQTPVGGIPVPPDGGAG
ncbi:MAG: deoxynucleoside kinase, partial [Armatimonadetes bacterium]|nr:deoxynucleoside kinase [Armatimonadota bacterium]